MAAFAAAFAIHKYLDKYLSTFLPVQRTGGGAGLSLGGSTDPSHCAS
jgi:hypothetical protein